MKNDFPGYFPEVRENILPKVTHISVRKKGGGKLQLKEHEEVYFVYTDMNRLCPFSAPESFASVMKTAPWG